MYFLLIWQAVGLLAHNCMFGYDISELSLCGVTEMEVKCVNSSALVCIARTHRIGRGQSWRVHTVLYTLCITCSIEYQAFQACRPVECCVSGTFQQSYTRMYVHWNLDKVLLSYVRTVCVLLHMCVHTASHTSCHTKEWDVRISWEMVMHLASTYVDTKVWEHLWIWKRVIGMISWIVLSSFPIDRIIPAYMSHFRLAPLGGWPQDAGCCWVHYP